jgi:hypothetical protein
MITDISFVFLISRSGGGDGNFTGLQGGMNQQEEDIQFNKRQKPEAPINN